jgi:hypothetical protein
VLGYSMGRTLTISVSVRASKLKYQSRSRLNTVMAGVNVILLYSGRACEPYPEHRVPNSRCSQAVQKSTNVSKPSCVDLVQ